jgi:sterol desaturase/sphingolipid hydroxylase (fatty acid hydroxylase superfamily)
MILMLVFTGPGAAVNLYGGALLGFALYEAFHYRLHFRLPANRIEAYLRARHLAHHDRDSQSCFGVTSPLWDRVFGTEPTLNCETVRMLAVRAPLAAKSNLGRFPRISTR